MNIQIKFLKNHFPQGCSTPCTINHITGKLVRQVPSKSKGFIFVFMAKIQILKSVPTLSGLNLMSNIGGMLGLMLGLGFLQLLQLADQGWTILINSCRTKKALMLNIDTNALKITEVQGFPHLPAVHHRVEDQSRPEEAPYT